MNILIVGGGFGGIKLTRELAKTPELFKVTLVSDQDCFRYYPGLYRTATGHPMQDSCMAIELLLTDLKNVTFKLGKAVKIDRAKQNISLESGEVLGYDTVVLALGVVTSYFGIPGMDKYSHGIKTIDQLEDLRRDLHDEFLDDRLPDKNYVVVGAGPTGVELSAALKQYLRRVAKLHHARSQKISLELIEAAPRILPRSSQRASELVAKQLRSLDIKIMAGKKVEGETPDSLMVDGRTIPTHTVIWTAGVTNNPFYAANKDQFELSEKGRVKVNQYMQVDEHTYVIGDNADMPYSGLALTAVRDARFVARHLRRMLKQKPLHPYKQPVPITAIPAGARWAVIEWRGLVFGGWLGGLLRWLADLVAYRDLMPFWQAVHVWWDDRKLQEDCDICEAND